MFFLSDPLLPSLFDYISLFPDLSPLGASVISVCLPFSVLEDGNRGNMIVHIVIDNKNGTMFPLPARR